MIDQIDFVRNAGETRRFHTWPVLRPQTVAEHSFHVAMLLHILYGQDEKDPMNPTLLLAGLCHDLAEWKVGDLPAPAKRSMGTIFPGFRSEWGRMEESLLSEVSLDWDGMLSDEERRRLKFVDAVDGCLYCIRERAMGNQLITLPFTNFFSYAHKEALNSGHMGEAELMEHVQEMWRQADDR